MPQVILTEGRVACSGPEAACPQSSYLRLLSLIDSVSRYMDTQLTIDFLAPFYAPTFSLLTKAEALKERQRLAKLRYRSKPENKAIENTSRLAWRLNNKERYAAWKSEYHKQYYNKNRDNIISQSKKWWSENRHKQQEKKRQYHSVRKDHANAKSREYHKAHRQTQLPKMREYGRRLRIENPEKVKLYEKRTRENAKADPLRMLIINQRGRIRVAFKRYLKGAKQRATLELLGCSLDFLKSHIESQFKAGMTWQNWTLKGWHIDHIRPCDSFDLTDPEQQKICFHYSNLQPLWWHENLRKGANCPA